ncbi:hypothetical protein BGZ49_000545 [Haplosporangium sp. Z 27]|nr:hypothetical protein BGZ49_000545 [Haplosporangium sp. Z 27]
MPKTSLTTLPPEILSHIFTLSSNPALVITSRELNQILAPLSKSTATRIEFLLVRYRGNYVKAVVKGLRWAFFDLGLLNSLDRTYRNEKLRMLESRLRQGLISRAKSLNEPHQIQKDTSSASGTTSASIPHSEPARKKRKKYHLPTLESSIQNPAPNDSSACETSHTDIVKADIAVSDTCNQEIPLPKDFPMPRRLFKSSKHMPLIQVLLSRGASPSYPSHYPLVRSSQRGDADMVRLLLENGATPDIKALRWACVEEMNEVVDVFVERGVKPDGQCLSWCVEKGKLKMVDRLLKMGVIPDLKTVLGL